MPEDCIFCRIAAKQLPAEFLYEDDEFIAIADITPQAPVHVILIPRAHYATIMDIEDVGLLGRAQLAIQRAVVTLGIAEDGFRIVTNCGANGGQTISHVHWHILGGRFMQWPPG